MPNEKDKTVKGCANIAELIMDHSTTTDVFGGKQSDSLDTLRYAKCMEMLALAKNIDPQKLPPTAHYHSLRVHLRVILWKEITANSLDPLLWGWKLDSSELQPIITDLEPAPYSLLKFIQCKCKLSTANPCGSNTCSWIKMCNNMW